MDSSSYCRMCSNNYLCDIIMSNLETLLYVLHGLFTVNVRVSYCPFKGQKKTTFNLNLDQPKITVLNIMRPMGVP